MTPPFKNERILALDLCRILACFCVCTEHLFPYIGISDISYSDMSGENIVTIYLFSFLEYGPPLFFMVSGALMLPMKTSTFGFLKKRFCRIGIPTIIWTCLYLFQMFYYNTPERARLLLTQLPFEPSVNGSFWFLYVLLGLYLLTPILSRWINACSRREIEFYLIFWVFISLLPYAFHISGSSISTNSPFYYFSGYVGFYLLGYYIRRYHPSMSLKSYLVVILLYLGVGGLTPWFERSIGMDHLVGAIGTNFGSVVRTAAIFISMFFFFGKYKSCGFIQTLSKLTFGVYLINVYVLWIISGFTLFQGVTPLLRLFLLAALCISFSFATVYLISYLPGSKFYIAYHHK